MFRCLILADDPPKTVDDFRDWSTEQLLRQIPIEETGQESADTDHEWFMHARALNALRRALEERGQHYTT